MLKNKVIIFLLAIAFHFIFNNIIDQKIQATQIINIHAFLFSIAITVSFFKRFFKHYFKNKTSALLIVNFLRMILALIFLWPILVRKDLFTKTYIIHFFISYFLYQYIDIYFYKKKKK